MLKLRHWLLEKPRKSCLTNLIMRTGKMCSFKGQLQHTFCFPFSACRLEQGGHKCKILRTSVQSVCRYHTWNKVKPDAMASEVIKFWVAHGQAPPITYCQTTPLKRSMVQKISLPHGTKHMLVKCHNHNVFWTSHCHALDRRDTRKP